MRHTKPQTKPVNAGGMPIRIDSALLIPADTSAVFAYLANLENNPMWNWAITETRPLDGAPRRGSRYKQSRSSPRGEETLEITAFRHDEHLEVTSTGRESIVYRYDFLAVAEHQTRLQLVVEMSPPSRFGRRDLFAARLASALAINLENLRAAILESQESLGRSGVA